MKNSGKSSFTSTKFDWIYISIYCLVLYGIGITTSSLWDNDEGWYASMALNMYQSNDWIVPIYNASVWFTKPPFMFWMMAIGMKIFGITEFAVRIFSVLFNVATVLLMYGWVRSMFNRRLALWTAWVMATGLLFAVVGRAAIAESYLVFFMTAAMACFWFSLKRTRTEDWWALACGLSMGFAMITKGPMGIGFPLLSIIAYCLWIGQGKVLLSRKTFLALIGCLLISSPWYIAGYLVSGPKIWYQFFIAENLLRFTVPSMGHEGPFWYHPPVLLLTFLPWSILLPWAYYHFYKSNKEVHKLIFSWISIPLIIYSVMITKLPHYLLHIFPALAIVVGWFIAKLIEENKKISNWSLAIGLLINVLLFIASFVLIKEEPVAIGWRLPLVLGLMPAGWLIAIVLNHKTNVRGAVISLGIGTAGFIVLLALVLFPHFEKYRLVKPLLAKLAENGFQPQSPRSSHLADLKTQNPDWLARALKADKVMFCQGDLIIPAMTFYSKSIVVRTSTDECAYLLKQSTPIAIVFDNEKWEEFIKKYPIVAQNSRILFEQDCIYEDEGRMRLIAVSNRKPL